MTKKLGLKSGIMIGLILAVACSGSADNINNAVNTIINAIDVLFDNNGTSLTATNVQTALSELDTRVHTLEAKTTALQAQNTSLEAAIKERSVFIEDDLGSELGYLIDAENSNNTTATSISGKYKLYSPILKAIVSIEAQGFSSYGIKTGLLRFDQANCQGTIYLEDSLQLLRNINRLYIGSPEIISGSSASFREDNGTCTNLNFAGPLHLAQDVTSQYPIYIQAPLKRVTQ